MLPLFGFLGYLAAAIAFFVLGSLVLLGRASATPAKWLVAAAIGSAVWGGSLALQIHSAPLHPAFLLIVETCRTWLWLLFLVSILRTVGGKAYSSGIISAAIAMPLAILVIGLTPLAEVFQLGSLLSIGSIALPILGVALLERIYRSTDPAFRRPVGFLVVALSGVFLFDLVLYSSTVLFGQLEPALWMARGAANALTVPLLVLAARQNQHWPVEIFVSRQAAYASATSLGAGIYLILMAVAGYWVKEIGGSLGSALAVVLVFLMALGLITLIVSERIRRRVQVFFSKHFFRNRYDYREEWRRLSQTLYTRDDDSPIGSRCIEAVARILSAESGYLLLQREGEGSMIQPFAAWHRELPEFVVLAADDPTVSFFQESGWIVDTYQFRDDPDFYAPLSLPGWLVQNENQQIVVPLLIGNSLIGLMILQLQGTVRLNFEDTDLLKIVGRQVAGLLAQQLDAERVAEGRQFQAYSKLTAFLMHDLKNLAAQQSLVVKNAEKHRQNPEFVDDAFTTIEHSVQRMNRLIAQLAERNRKPRTKQVDVVDVIASVIETVSDRRPVPTLDSTIAGMTLAADPDKLAAIYTHLLRNAQDATAETGEISVSIFEVANGIEVRIADTGKGMDDTFVREHLFKPFESTKGADGMGIGAYQAREYVAELGGRLDVSSQVGEGTTMKIFMPASVQQ